MSAHVYHEVYLHVNWHTKDDRPMLTGQTEQCVHEALRRRCRESRGVYLHGLGGTDDHVHLALSIEPSVCIGELIGRLKGGSSHDVNQADRRVSVQWQRGFGVVRFGKKRLGWVAGYVTDQRQHHRTGKVYERLERHLGLPG